MKETEFKIEEKQEVVAMQQQESKTVLINRLKPESGHRLFEYDTKDNTIRYAEFRKEAVDFVSAQKGMAGVKKSVIMKESCIYISALNKKNADKKLSKMAGFKIVSTFNK